MPGDCFCNAPRSTHVMAIHKHGEAPDPCKVPSTQSFRFEKAWSESPREVLTWYFIGWRVCSSVDTAFVLASKRLRAIPPTEGIILSKAALQSLLKIIADCCRSANPSYDTLFRRIASVDDQLGRDPHCDNGIVPRSSAQWIRWQPNMICSAMFRSASTSWITRSLSIWAHPLDNIFTHLSKTTFQNQSWMALWIWHTSH